MRTTGKVSLRVLTEGQLVCFWEFEYCRGITSYVCARAPCPGRIEFSLHLWLQRVYLIIVITSMETVGETSLENICAFITYACLWKIPLTLKLLYRRDFKNLACSSKFSVYS